MDIHSIRSLVKTKSIYDIALRVTFYARVSSESDEQLNSLGNQISYYEDLIKRNQNWTFIRGYIDEGLSGISTKRRENFNRMIEDAAMDKFDLIITKEISRFARNTLDSIQFTRQLLGYGVGVFFQNDNINTLDEDSELRLSIMSSIAQDELRKLSSRVKFGHQQAIKDKVVLGNSRIFGYVKDGGRLIIDEDQANMVRELFELYATGQYSMKQIETIFWQKGYRNHNSNKIAHTTMSNMIANPKYKGYYVGNKVRVIDMFSKKQKFLPPEEWVMFKDESGEIVPAIVSEELWDQANEILHRRSKDVKSRQGICNHPNLLTGKMYCTHCGAAYYRRDSVDRKGNKNSKWVCSGKIKNGADSCPSFHIYEEELKPLLLEVFQECSVDVEEIINEYTEMYKTLTQDDTIAQQIQKLQQSIELGEKKKQKLLMFNALGELSDSDFLSMNKQCTGEIESAHTELTELIQQQDSAADFKKHMDTIRRVLREASADAANGLINKEFVDHFIDKIYATIEDDGAMHLQIKVFTGKTTDKYLASLRSRTGQMSKKMLGKVVKRVKELNEKIRIAREQVARKEQLTACIDAVKTQRRELDRKLISLRVALREEEADVQKLENAKLSRFFLSLTGKLETRLEQERQEARQAAIRYDTAQKELLELDRQLAQYCKELGTLGDCHLRYQRLMGQKRERLKTESSEIAEKLQELERQALALRRQRKEVGEAITVGRQAKSTANGILSKLEEALGYSTWDMMGGGLLADLAKHDTLDEAQAMVNSLQSLLRRFKTELADVQISSDLQVSVDGFLHFADYFFDSLFVDWAVRGRIESARGRIRDTMWQIDSVLNKLTAMQATLDARLAALQEKSDNLIQTTDL